jgi:hypothetical protein
VRRRQTTQLRCVVWSVAVGRRREERPRNAWSLSSSCPEWDLCRHLTFGHPSNLQSAVSLAEEYDAFECANGKGGKRKPDGMAASLGGNDQAGIVAPLQVPKVAKASPSGASRPEGKGGMAQQVEDLSAQLAEMARVVQGLSQQGGNRRPTDGQGSQRQDRGCYHCEKFGHFKRECPELRQERNQAKAEN